MESLVDCKKWGQTASQEAEQFRQEDEVLRKNVEVPVCSGGWMSVWGVWALGKVYPTKKPIIGTVIERNNVPKKRWFLGVDFFDPQPYKG